MATLNPSPVLISYVEDDRLDVIALQRALRKRGAEYPLEHYEDGAPALDAARDCEWPGLVLAVIDLNLPTMSGLEVLEKLRQIRSPRCVALVLTTSTAPADRARAMSLGARVFLSKSDGGSLDAVIDWADRLAAQSV